MNITAALQIPGWMSERELAWLASAASRSHAIVEIGSWRGRSTRVLADHTPGTVIAVDTWDDAATGFPGWWTAGDQSVGLYSRRDWLWQEFRYNLAEHIEDNVLPLRMWSDDAARLLAANMLRFDMIFIDGDHRYASVRDDIERWSPLLKPGGLLSGHDYEEPTCPEVARAVRETVRAPLSVCDTIWFVG